MAFIVDSVLEPQVLVLFLLDLGDELSYTS